MKRAIHFSLGLFLPDLRYLFYVFNSNTKTALIPIPVYPKSTTFKCAGPNKANATSAKGFFEEYPNSQPANGILCNNKIKSAKRRIFLSSLYVGHDEHELLKALETALQTQPDLRVTLQLDYFRSTRPGPDCTANALLPLLKAHPERFKVHLYKSPTLRGLLAKVVPRRFDEGWGTWHAKVYGVDDDVLLSGANLNRSYFINRQDRYLLFTSNSILANYCHQFLDLFSRYSFELKPLSTPSAQQNSGIDKYELQWSPSIAYTDFPHQLSTELKTFQATQQSKLLQQTSDEDVDLIPLIQSGPLRITEEQTALTHLLTSQLTRATPSRSLIQLTSGYFALYTPYHPHILHSNCKWDILAASPLANGFYGSKGISGRIPEGYTILEQRFWRGVKEAGKDADVSLREWERPGWTYHAKGIWFRPNAEEPPTTTLFGSTNLNSRSANLDTELSFILHTNSSTSSADLRQSLAKETEQIWQYSHQVDEETWKHPDRAPRFSTRLIVAAVENML